MGDYDDDVQMGRAPAESLNRKKKCSFIDERPGRRINVVDLDFEPLESIEDINNRLDFRPH